MCFPFLHQLVQSGHLLPGPTRHSQEREQSSKERLERLPNRTYLQNYDLLFRYVNLWLGKRGYELSNRQPHQVLARVCAFLDSTAAVQEMIRCRHAMKYTGEPPTLEGSAALASLLARLQKA